MSNKVWRYFIITLSVITSGMVLAKELQAVEIIVYKSPSCECCNGWIEHLRQNGFTVTVEKKEDMDATKQRFGVPERLQSCHTGVMGKYIVEGHVPADDLHRLLREAPVVAGITVPGMPVGSPGMEIPGQKPDRYNVLTFTKDGVTKVFASH